MPKALAAASVAAAAVLLASGPVEASIVRLQDVENEQMREGITAATQGDYIRAERIFKLMLMEEGPSVSNASTWSNLGNVEMQLGRAAEAAEDYSRAIELAPEAPVPYLNRAIAYEQLGVESASSSSGGGREAAGEQAVAWWRQAEEDCSTAIRLDPQEFAAYFNRGNVEMRLGEYARAEQDFTAAADLAPGIAGYRLRAAELAFQNGREQEATRQLRAVVRRSPQLGEAHAALAAALYRQGAVAQAEEELLRATELDPRLGSARQMASLVRWPPALEAAMLDLLTLGGASKQ